MITLDIKKTLLAFACCAAACACTREIGYHRNDIRPQLQMFAQMAVGDTVHVVHLAISEDATVRKIASGTVKCYINGNLAAEGRLVDGDMYVRDDVFESWLTGKAPSRMGQASFAFKAGFEPGDLVRIEATADDGKYVAYSEVTVPKAPVVEVVDTTYARENNESSPFSGNPVYRVRIKGRDLAGEKDYYRLTAGASVLLEACREADPPYHGEVCETFRFGERSLRLDKGNDPILQDGAPAGDVDLTGASQNIFNVFSDNMFADGNFNLSFSVNAWGLLAYPSIEGQYDRIKMTTTLHARVSGIGEVEYNYLKALSIYQYMEGDISFTEPVSFPDNVTGGVGVVSISTPGEGTIDFVRQFRPGTLYY